MERILVLANTEVDGLLGKPALEVLGAALVLGGELTIGTVGPNARAAAAQVAGCGTRVLAVEDEAFAQGRYATDAAAAEALCRVAEPALVLAPTTPRWSRALPGVAQRLGGRIDTHAAGIAEQNGTPVVTRWFYRQRIETVLTRAQRQWFILLDSGCSAPYAGAPGEPRFERVVMNVPATRTTVVGIQAPPAEEQTIRPDAKLLFVAGAGWTKKQSNGAVQAAEAEQLILNFLRASKASLGGSKSLVDLSGEGEAVLKFMTHLNQVGQTGSTPRHPKGLSTCCHGEEPHTVGWRFIAQRRAINLDPNCGWARGNADVLYVADAFAVMRKLMELIA